jgi:hypothetical protein
MFVVGLGSGHRRSIRDHDGNDRMIHSLEGMSCLKVDHENHLRFACQKFEKREI